jgi:hypothetical protein
MADRVPRVFLIIGLMLASFLAAAAAMLVALDDDLSVHYATSAEARADDAFGRGWLPRVLPDSAFDIDERHNLDTNRGHGTFRFTEKDAGTFRTRLRPAGAAEIANIDGAERLGNGYSFYAFEDFILAINWRTQRAEFWLLRDDE